MSLSQPHTEAQSHSGKHRRWLERWLHRRLWWRLRWLWSWLMCRLVRGDVLAGGWGKDARLWRWLSRRLRWGLGRRLRWWPEMSCGYIFTDSDYFQLFDRIGWNIFILKNKLPTRSLPSQMLNMPSHRVCCVATVQGRAGRDSPCGDDGKPMQKEDATHIHTYSHRHSHTHTHAHTHIHTNRERKGEIKRV